jgi:hypothetical protein
VSDSLLITALSFAVAVAVAVAVCVCVFFFVPFLSSFFFLLSSFFVVVDDPATSFHTCHLCHADAYVWCVSLNNAALTSCVSESCAPGNRTYFFTCPADKTHNHDILGLTVWQFVIIISGSVLLATFVGVLCRRAGRSKSGRSSSSSLSVSSRSHPSAAPLLEERHMLAAHQYDPVDHFHSEAPVTPTRHVDGEFAPLDYPSGYNTPFRSPSPRATSYLTPQGPGATDLNFSDPIGYGSGSYTDLYSTSPEDHLP